MPGNFVTYPLVTQRGAATGSVINLRDALARGGVVPVIFTSTHVLDTVGNNPLVIGIRMPNAFGEVQVALLAFSPQTAWQLVLICVASTS